MAGTKRSKTKSKEKTLEQKRRDAKNKRKYYEKIKYDPQKCDMVKEKDRQRYLRRKAENKIKSVANMTPKERMVQRKKWRESSKRHRLRLRFSSFAEMSDED